MPQSKGFVKINQLTHSSDHVEEDLGKYERPWIMAELSTCVSAAIESSKLPPSCFCSPCCSIMARSLRTRTSRVNYAAMVGVPTDAEEGEATAQHVDFQGSDGSGSDFAPEPKKGKEDSEPDDESEPEENDNASQDDPLDLDDDEPVAFSTTKKKPSKSKKKSNGSVIIASSVDVIKPVFGASNLARSSKRQMYVLPTQSVKHRHRAVPLFARTTRVERISEFPQLFGPYSSVPTNNLTQHPRVTDRVSKAWGFNVGPGPVWELVEDRAWFKEARPPNSENFLSDADSRPIVYPNIRCRADLHLLSPE